MMLASPEASAMLRSPKVTNQHRGRAAIVYVRQSTTKQVQQHRESQQNQYGLVQRALGLGWVPERVRVIDADQGSSGQDGQRPGFRELVAEVSLGRVGLILAYEASRLARNNADWYALLDLAALRGTLLADTEGVSWLVRISVPSAAKKWPSDARWGRWFAFPLDSDDVSRARIGQAGPCRTSALTMEPPMLARFLCRVAQAAGAALRAARDRLSTATKPAASPVLAGAFTDLTRSRP